jgi:outer membrane lipopolysaccharide assembly protein LptE/RlpB
MSKHLLPIFISLLLLSACGFTLRGSNDAQLFSPDLQQIQLSSSNAEELAQLLRRRLLASGIDLVENSSSYKLSLGDEQILERVVSVNRNARAGEYELSLLTSIQLDKDAETLIPREIISVEQVYEADPANAAAKTNEAELVRNELRQALVEQIIRRLQSVQ